MTIVFAVLLGAAALLALAYPILFRRGGEDAAASLTSAQESLDELMVQRETAFQSIRDLQFDHEVGKVTDEDFHVYEADLKQNAAVTLRRLDAWESQIDGELALVEHAVAARRAALSSRPACPACGRAVSPGTQFCTGCGARLAPAAPAPAAAPAVICAGCGKALSPGDRFCPRCGQPIAQPVAGKPSLT